MQIISWLKTTIWWWMDLGSIEKEISVRKQRQGEYFQDVECPKFTRKVDKSKFSLLRYSQRLIILQSFMRQFGFACECNSGLRPDNNPWTKLGFSSPASLVCLKGWGSHFRSLRRQHSSVEWKWIWVQIGYKERGRYGQHNTNIKAESATESNRVFRPIKNPWMVLTSPITDNLKRETRFFFSFLHTAF